ncbi:carbohydrate ABC transporter permease [Actinomyces respiraculi]|uniref:Carbohydrate ABC transporter permease n=2 Tax=Actinomycetaceae TaxID=2049 RepID=A0A7T0LJS6_9ACTO|nr:carbohydrate ABC transporter permease [Actinomyces respiraculi]QPL05062.1 carbohydrate ABC transporter permease [Actinomyces respiraculi]
MAMTRSLSRPPSARGGGRRRHRLMGTVAANIAVLAVAVVAAFPILVVVVTALSPQQDVLSWPPALFPQSWTLSNVPGVFERLPVWQELGNTVMLSVSVTVLSLVLDSLMAYALAFIPFRGRSALFVTLIVTMMIPFQTLLVPLYKMLSAFGLVGTMVGMVIPRAADVMGIFLLRQFFIQIPQDLHNAARIDGASEFRIYRSIVLPNAAAGLLTLGMFNFIGNWNDMLWPMVMSNSAEERTLTAGLALLNGTSLGTIPYGVTMAGSLISVIPLVVVFAFIQKRFIEGVASTGIKG